MACKGCVGLSPLFDEYKRISTSISYCIKYIHYRNKSELSCAVAKSTCRVILHHLGSVAFGAFIITLVKLPRLILMYIEKK